MGWATTYIQKLSEGETVSFRPQGSSMEGKISSGQLCTVAPRTIVINNLKYHAEINVNDIVLCKVNGSEYLHLVTATKGKQYQISNNKGHVNGWITANAVYGLCIKVE